MPNGDEEKARREWAELRLGEFETAKRRREGIAQQERLHMEYGAYRPGTFPYKMLAARRGESFTMEADWGMATVRYEADTRTWPVYDDAGKRIGKYTRKPDGSFEYEGAFFGGLLEPTAEPEGIGWWETLKRREREAIPEREQVRLPEYEFAPPEREAPPWTEILKRPPMMHLPPEKPKAEILFPDLPPEGFDLGEGLTLMRSGEVISKDVSFPVGHLDPETGKFSKSWQVHGMTALEKPLKALEVLLTPIRIAGKAIFALAQKSPEEWATIREQHDELIQQRDIELAGVKTSEQRKVIVDRYVKKLTAIDPATSPEWEKQFRELPWYKQLMYESPVWLALGFTGLSALKGWRAVATLPTPAKVTARVALAPLAGVEIGVGVTLKYGIIIPITKGIPAASRKLLQVALDQGLDKWIATQGRVSPEFRPIWQNWILKNKSWLIEKATDNMLRRQAERKGVQYAANKAASDTVEVAEPLLLQAGKVKAPVAKPPTVPPEFAVEKPFVREVPIKPPPVTPVKPTEVAIPPRPVEEVALSLDQATAEIEGITAYLATESARRVINLIKKTGFLKGEIPNLTLKQYRDLTGKAPLATILTPDGKYVRWEYALDDVATEMGYPSGEALREAIMATSEMNTRLIALKDQKARLVGEMREIEAPPSRALAEQIREVYTEIGVEIKATQAALVGMKGEEAKIARTTLKMLETQLKYTETHLKSMADIEATKPVVKQLRQKIHAVAAFKGLPKTQLDRIKKSATGKSLLMSMTQPELETVLAQVRQARPVSIKGERVITPITEGKIQSLKRSLVADKYLTDNSFQRLVNRLGLTTSRYENQYRFITEKQGKDLIRAMNDEAEIGYTKLQALWQEGLNKNPKVAAEVEELQKRIAKEGGVYFQGKPADASVLKDMRFVTEDLETRTGEPFYHIYFLMNRKHLDIRMELTRLKRKQIGSTPEFRKLIGNESALERINKYIASKNKWLAIKSPPDITPEEKKLANALEEALLELQPDFRLHRFTNFYGLYKGDVDKIAMEIPDAPKADIKAAVDILESQGADKLKVYLDTKTWGIIDSGFEPHYVVNPNLAARKLHTTFPTGRFKARDGVEFYPADLNIVQRVDRYSSQMLSFSLRPYVREMERIYREAIPRLKNPSRVRGILSGSANEMMGYVERGGILYNYIIKFAAQAYATVFGTMPVLPFRNLFQNLAFHPDKSALVDPRNRVLNAGDWEFYHTYVSQMESIPRDLMLSEEGGLPLLGKLNQFIYRLNIYGASDSKVNRVWCYWASLNKAERALKAYKIDGDVRKFISASGLSGLTHLQQVDVLKTLTINEAKAIREIALEETNNVHFLYDRSQRAYIEMGGMGRVFGSLVIFPRSVLQRVFKQFAVLDPKSWATDAKKKRALKILLSMAMGSIAANHLFAWCTGRRDTPYNPLNILLWTPGGLVIGSIVAITDVIGGFFMAMSGNDFALKELPAKMERAGDTMMPFYKLLMTSLESALNLKYIDRLTYRELRSIVEKKMWEMGFLDKTAEELYIPNRKFYEAERTWDWKIKHAIFATEPPPPDPLVKAVEDITTAEDQLGKFIMTEDSDDGYNYELVNLASDIRKATNNLKAEDITAENGFSPMVLKYMRDEELWDAYYDLLPADDRIPFRESTEGAYIEASLFFWGKLRALRNPNSQAIVQKWVDDFAIPNKAIPALGKVLGFGG